MPGRTRVWVVVMMLLIAMPSGKALTFNVDPAKVSALTLFVFSSCVRVPCPEHAKPHVLLWRTLDGAITLPLLG